MLAIRLQRIGRKKAAVYRVAVQESHRHPSSGRVVTYVGSYDPHAKTTSLDKEKVTFYLKNGAQPSPRVVRLLEGEKIALPTWVSKPDEKKRSLRNPDKLRKNQPKEEPAEETAESAAKTEEAPTNETAEPKEDNEAGEGTEA